MLGCLQVGGFDDSCRGEEPDRGAFVDALEDELPGAEHDLNDPEDGGDGDSLPGEVDDAVLGDAGTEIVDADEVLDLVHGRGVGVHSPGFEDVGHVGFGLDKPFQGLEEVGLGQGQPRGFVDGRDHGEFVDVDLAAGDVVDELGMVRGGWAA